MWANVTPFLLQRVVWARAQSAGGVGKAALEPSKRAVEDFPRLGPVWEGLTDDDIATRPGPPGR